MFFDISEIAKYEVQMKFFNWNVEDMFEDNNLGRLLEIFKSWLWKESNELYITLVESPIRLGGRRPTNPKDKDGYVCLIQYLE